MSEQTPANTNDTTSETPVVSASQTIGQKVAETISQAGPAVLAKVIDRLAAIEIDKRVSALENAVNAAVTTKRELQKIKPDNVQYDITGKAVVETYTKAKIEEKQKLEQKLAKIEKAVDKAINKGDFGDLFNLKSE